MSDSLWPHGLQPARHLCSWGFPSKNTGVGFYSLLHGILLTQGLNPGFLFGRQILYCLSCQGRKVCLVCHVWMWELDHKESSALKNWCFWIVVLEKTLKSSLDCKEIKPVNPKGNQSWIFIGRTDAETEAPIHWPHDVKNWLIGKDPDAGKDWRQEEKGMTEDEMVGWYHWLNEYEFEPTLGDGEECRMN